MTYRVLDLFSGAGGSAWGLHLAWPDAEIVGVDIAPQKHYPFTFVQGDALNPPFDLKEFDFIWASPVCKGYSTTAALWDREHPLDIPKVRSLLEQSGRPYVIENVKGAPLRDPIMLVGTMFGLKVWRPRLFESNCSLSFELMPPLHAKHAAMGRKPKSEEFITPAGHFSDVPYARRAMGIDWMTQGELAQAIPPAYSFYIARQIRQP